MLTATTSRRSASEPIRHHRSAEASSPNPVGSGSPVTRRSGGTPPALPEDSGVLAETVLSPDVLRPGVQLIDLLGIAQLVVGKDDVELKAGGQTVPIELPAPSVKEGVRYYYLGLAIENGDTVTVLTGASAVRRTVPVATSNGQVRWLVGARGMAYGIGVSTFLGKPPSEAKGLQALPCVVGKLEPGRTQPVAERGVCDLPGGQGLGDPA